MSNKVTVASIAVENYLKSLWQLGSENVSTADLAQQLGVAPASATKMVQRLTEKGLVLYVPYRGATLTSKGELKALSVVRRHRLLETFLAKTLSLGHDQIHKEAENLEHALSKELEDSISIFLNNPTRDPHGHPIPGPNGEIEIGDDLLLVNCPLGKAAIVTQIPDDSSEILSWLEDKKIYPGSKIKLISNESFEGGLTIDCEGEIFQISSIIANSIYVSFMEL